jgi:hypothetical protein
MHLVQVCLNLLLDTASSSATRPISTPPVVAPLRPTKRTRLESASPIDGQRKQPTHTAQLPVHIRAEPQPQSTRKLHNQPRLSFQRLHSLLSTLIAIWARLQLLVELMQALHRGDDHLVERRDGGVIEERLESRGRSGKRRRIRVKRENVGRAEGLNSQLDNPLRGLEPHPPRKPDQVYRPSIVPKPP